MSCSAVLTERLLYDLLAREKESGTGAVCPASAETGMMKTPFFQAQDLSENIQFLVKPDTVLCCIWPQTAALRVPSLQLLLGPDGLPGFPLTFREQWPQNRGRRVFYNEISPIIQGAQSFILRL